MKNQYFGDVNDYRKYGLLRALQSDGGGRLLVAWMLTSDDGGGDGGFRSYLDVADRWSAYDPALFAGLAGLLCTAQQPSVSLIEASDLLPRASYFSAVVPDGRTERDQWRTELFRVASGVDLVFVDPDNGIEVPSKPVGRKGSSKYVTWNEVEGLWKAGCSVLIYQHFPRKPRQPFAERLAADLRACTGACFVEAFRTPHVLFLLAAQDRHAQRYEDRIALLAAHWNGEIRPMGLANNSMQLAALRTPADAVR
ncbi:hypothetical protein [Acidithiobacillus sp. AMEEHan]|uniref:hypothetical protein n=1 Tax=Acidithiobacillus sp. AMEEHan TaxID=2994951 RepID=UPI0027E44CD4|nr:hypothetical protein [Acidithiobacillus sp. AMEEHan]